MPVFNYRCYNCVVLLLVCFFVCFSFLFLFFAAAVIKKLKYGGGGKDIYRNLIQKLTIER